MSIIRGSSKFISAPVSKIWLGSLSRTSRSRIPSMIRCNSTTSTTSTIQQDQQIQNQNNNNNNTISLAAQIYPTELQAITEDDVDAWLDAVTELKHGKHQPDTEKEIYLQQLTNPEPFLEEENKFVPTQEQLSQVEFFQSIKIPLQSDPLIDNLTNLIMRHGRKSQANKTVSRCLYIIYLKTRKDPVQVLYETIDKLSPLMGVQTQKTGTAKNKTVPFPLNTRQRNRFAILWLIEGSEKKKSTSFSVRLAEEIISAFEGKSSGFDKKAQMHKVAISQRAYITI